MWTCPYNDYKITYLLKHEFNRLDLPEKFKFKLNDIDKYLNI